MLNDINLNLFHLINATKITSSTILKLIIFLAKQLIFFIPLITITFWFFGKENNLVYQRVFICKTILAFIIGLSISGFIGATYPYERPCVLKIGQCFLSHTSTPSFPSTHATVAFVFSFGSLFWLKYWIGLLFFVLAFTVSLARIFLGIHWPLDILGALLVSIISCGVSQTIWRITGNKLFFYTRKAYQTLFAPLIKKGCIKK